MLLCCQRGFIAPECRATNAGRIGWRLGGEPRTARRDGRESSGRLFTNGGAADADLFHHVFLERTGSAETSTPTTASSGETALCGDVWSLATAWTAGQSRSTDAL